MWARKEFRNYKLMYDAGASVPKPVFQHENVLVMEFIGRDGVRAPLLREIILNEDEYVELFKNVLADVRKIYLKANLVHGDLSEYNIMIWEGRHYIIDVSQAVKISHPNAYDFLVRDLRNLRRYFGDEVGIEVPSLQEMIEYVVYGKELSI